MKVLQINSICGSRSTGRICTDIAEILNINGHENMIAYGRDPIPPEHREHAFRIGSNMDIYRHAATSLLFDSAGFGSLSATSRFVDWVDRYNPDIIHLHNMHGYYINMDVLFNYLSQAKKRVVWTMHDCWAFTGHCPYFSAVQCDRWKTICHDCPQKTKYPMSYLLDRSKSNWSRKRDLFTSVPDMTIVTPSRWLAGLAGESFLGKYPVKVIGNGIDTGVFRPEPSDFRERYGLENQKIILGVASVWEERKGLKDFIALSRKLEGGSRIVIAGLSRLQSAGMPKEMICLGRTNDPKELARLYSAADVFLNLTYEDNYPTTNLEAQACGTPVISYHSGGSLETIHSGDVYDIKAGDIESVYHALNGFAYGSKKSSSRTDFSVFDKKRMADGYMNLYCERREIAKDSEL